MPSINIRVSKEVKAYLKELAAKEGMTLSAMLRSVSKKRALEILKKNKRR